MRRKEEKVPENHWKKRFPELEKDLLDMYYKFKGWSNQGTPTKESLHEFGLGYIFEEFENSEINSENGDTPSKETLVKNEKEV